MAAETPQVASAMAASKGKRHRKRAKTRLDYRLAVGRRVKELVQVFAERLGPDAEDPVTMAAIKRAAETSANAESLRRRMLRVEAVSPDDVLRASRTADMLTRRLHLDQRHRTRPDGGPSLSDILSEEKQHEKNVQRAVDDAPVT